MRHLIESGLQAPWYRLALPPALETRFRREVAAPAGWYVQTWLTILIVFNLVSTWMDVDAFGTNGIAVPFVLTMGVCVPVAIGSIVICRGRPSLSRQAVVAAVNALVDMAIVLNSARLVPSAKADAYLMLAALLPFAIGTIMTIPFRHGLWLYGSAFAMYVAAVIASPPGDHFQEGLPILCSALILVPLKVSFSRERDAKRGFLLELLARIQADELRAINERLVVLSGTDPLTGLCNRRAFTEGLEKTWLHACETGAWLGVAVIDIDEFKRFNDASGHAAGDHCLVEVARAMNDVMVKAGGIVGRYGGEEFAAYLPGASRDMMREIGDSLLQAVRALRVEHKGLAAGRMVSVSIGVTAALGMKARQGVAAAKLLRAADDALYAAKRGGRDRVVGDDHLAVPAVPPQDRMMAEGRLRHA